MTLREEILCLLDSVELQQYLLTHPDKLQVRDYADLVAGAPVSLVQKKELLERLLDETEWEKDTDGHDQCSCYLRCLEDALKGIEGGKRKRGILAVSLRAASDGQCGDNLVDGFYFAPSMGAAQKAIRAYRLENDDDDWDWEHLYWKIEQYSPGSLPEYDGFWQTECIYIANSSGEIQYFLDDRYRKKTTAYAWAAKAFGEDSVSLNLPVSYRPGDILEIDCSPYAFGPRYCILTEVGDDCCGIQCLYPGKDGKIGRGALKHGHFFSDAYKGATYLSPLYRARIYTGELPAECKFMEKLSDKLHADPDFGKTLLEMEWYLGFAQPC